MLHRLNLRILLTAIAMCLAMVGQVAAQSVKAQHPIIVDGNNNETSKTALALLAQTVSEDNTVFLIARLGVGESSRALSRRRLQVVHSYLDVGRATPIPRDRVVTAEGEPVRDLGRVEVYLGDKLFMIFTLKRNKNFAPEA